MSIREKLNNNSVLVGIVATLALIIALVSVVFSGRTGGAESGFEGKWFIDLTTNKLFVGKLTDIPPIDAPSGQSLENGQAAGVWAHVFACGDSSKCRQDLTGKTLDELDSLGVFVAYLEKMTPDAKAEFEEMMEKFGSKPAMMDHMLEGRLIRSPKRGRWINAMSEYGREMQLKSSDRCGQSSDLRICRSGMVEAR